MVENVLDPRTYFLTMVRFKHVIYETLICIYIMLTRNQKPMNPIYAQEPIHIGPWNPFSARQLRAEIRAGGKSFGISSGPDAVDMCLSGLDMASRAT